MADLAALDLNLFVALDALLAERSVTRAAKRIGVTQPAMSQALARLRAVFGDPLFVRTAQGIVPTARAEALAVPLRQAMLGLQRVVDAPAAFDPATLQRSFTIGASDYAEVVLLPRLLARLAREAPGVRLVLRPAPESSFEPLEDGALDLAVGIFDEDRPTLRRQALFRDRMVSIVREGHPVLSAPLTVERYADLPHALITVRGDTHGLVDTALAALGLRRRIVLVLPHFLAGPLVVAQSDVVQTLPEHVVRSLPAATGLRVLEPPLALPAFSVSQTWHERVDRDPAHAWLRRLVREAAPGATG